MSEVMFRELVKRMRTVQKAWFKGDRSSETLSEAKRLERAVDKAIQEGDQEPDLFSRSESAGSEAQS